VKNKHNRTLLLLAAVCLVIGTGGKPWINKAAKERRGGYRAHLIRSNTRADHFSVVTFYAVGDWGAESKERDRMTALLRADVARIGPREVKPFVLGLGDNLYPNGLPEGWPEDHVPGLKIDRAFQDVFDRVRYQNKGLTYHVVHGNHDYRGDILLWETFVEGRYEGTYDNSRFVSYSLHHDDIMDTNSETEYEALKQAVADGEAINRPELIPLPTDEIAIIALDTEALLHLYVDYRDNYDEENPPPSATLIGQQWNDLQRLLDANKDVSWIFVVGHHPIASHGVHGGHHPRPLGLHLEGLFEGTKSLVGLKDLQDLNHPAYKEFADRLYRILAAAGRNIIYVSGHEHSLQFLDVKSNVLQVISGSGSKLSPVSKGSDTIYKNKETGLVRFDVTGDQLWVEFIESHSVKKQQAYVFRIER